MTRVIGSVLGQTATGQTGEDVTAINANVAASLNATLAASNILAQNAAKIAEPKGFQEPGAYVETFGVTTCIM